MKEIKLRESKQKQQKLVEDVDYYFDQGLMVLTAHYLSKRGYCCGNGCRHCPYPDAQKSNLQ
jgi:hypothetical protein